MTIRDWFNKEVNVGHRVYVDTAKEAMEGEVVMKDDDTFTLRDDKGICRVIVTDDLSYYEIQ